MKFYVSKVTGEICEGWFNVLCTIWTDFWRFHVVNLRWTEWGE